jgi:hypothetical protein
VLCPGYQLPGPEAVANGTKVLLTGDEQYILRIGPASAAAAAAAAAAGRSSNSNGPSTAAAGAGTGRSSNSKMVLTDVQKSKANIIDGPFTPESTPGMSVYLVDKVLRSGEYRRCSLHISCSYLCLVHVYRLCLHMLLTHDQQQSVRAQIS